MACGACLAKGTTCGTGDCDGHAQDSSGAVMGVIRNFASKGRANGSTNSFNPFGTVRTRNPIDAFRTIAPMSRGAGAVGGTGTGQFDYAGNPSDPTKTPDVTSGGTGGASYLAAVPGLVDATANALSTVITATRGSSPTSTSTQALSATVPNTVTTAATSAPLGVPIPYWIGAAAVVGGAFWWASKKGRRRR